MGEWPSVTDSGEVPGSPYGLRKLLSS
jgi:hypothetical protein